VSTPDADPRPYGRRAFLALYISFFLFLGHLYLSLINPKTRHSLNGITRGWVDEDWARAHHAKWAAEARSEEL
jgi:cytochrome b subunit of formate dehydrogenase